jgi:anti-sigma B factor antagonist
MAGMGLSTRRYRSRIVVALRGELDVAAAGSAAAALAALTAHRGEIIIDLAGLEFIDCRGLAALAGVRNQARQAGGDLLLAAPQPQVRRDSCRLRHDRCLHPECQRGRCGRPRGPGAGTRRAERGPARRVGRGLRRGARTSASPWPERLSRLCAGCRTGEGTPQWLEPPACGCRELCHLMRPAVNIAPNSAVSLASRFRIKNLGPPRSPQGSSAGYGPGPAGSPIPAWDGR